MFRRVWTGGLIVIACWMWIGGFELVSGLDGVRSKPTPSTPLTPLLRMIEAIRGALQGFAYGWWLALTQSARGVAFLGRPTAVGSLHHTTRRDWLVPLAFAAFARRPPGIDLLHGITY